MSQHTTRSQKNLISKNLRELSIMLSNTTKHVRKSKSTASDSDVESSSKRQKSDFIAYNNAFSEEESLLKCFNKTLKPPIFVLSTTLPNVEMASQQPSEIDWMRQQMAQMQTMMEQMSRSQRPVDPEELERQRQHEQEKQQHEQEMTQMHLQIIKVKIKISTADLSSIQIIHKENKIADF